MSILENDLSEVTYKWDDGDCYDGVYVTSVRQAKVFLKSCEEFLNDSMSGNF